MKWWHRNNLRLIQNNLRETDACLDAHRIVEQAAEFNANTLMINTGGIVAFYPTSLEYHYKSPYLKGDMIGELIKECKAKNIRFFARFDFSKAHESIYEKHPEWFYKSPKGDAINYNGMVHTCVNGYYQQEYSLKILSEVLGRYEIDGVFFNMFGYKTTDYSNNYYGICHCENCKKRFWNMYGLSLPDKEDDRDPIFQKYDEFKTITLNEMLEKIRNLVKSKNSNIAISTYTDFCVDIVRKESNTEIHRPYPLWLYSASENVKSVEDTWTEKTISNCSINAVGLDYRFMGVSEDHSAVRLYQNIASGSGLDFCIIGVFDGYPDRENFPIVKSIFKFHKENEKYFGNFLTSADILVVKPDKFTGIEQEMEYLGIFKILKEEHFIFDSVLQKNMAEKIPERQYKAIIIPDNAYFNIEQLYCLKNAYKHGTSLIATNLSFIGNEEGKVLLKEVFGVSNLKKQINARWGYLDLSESKSIFSNLQQKDWVFIDGNLLEMEYMSDVQKHLNLLNSGMFGPPEKCYGFKKSGIYGVGIRKKNNASAIHVPWQPSMLYQKYGYEAHKKVFIALIDYSINKDRIIETNLPINVEVFFNEFRENGVERNKTERKKYILQLVNLSGYNGMTFFKPNKIMNSQITIRGIEYPTKVYSLVSKADMPFKKDGDNVIIQLNEIGRYESLIIE